MAENSIFKPADKRQAQSIRRFLMSVSSSLFVLLLMFALSYQGYMEEEGIVYSTILMLFFFLLFGVIFFSGMNLKAADPSLTIPQMASSIVVLIFAMFYCSSDGRGLLLLIFLVTFIFGVLSLQTRELLI